MLKNRKESHYQRQQLSEAWKIWRVSTMIIFLMSVMKQWRKSKPKWKNSFSVKGKRLRINIWKSPRNKTVQTVMLDYLVKVMKAMAFPDKFISWMLMLHEGATACFLLNFLSNPINVFFQFAKVILCPCCFILFI